MSRPTTRPRPPSPTPTTTNPADEVCPVCKSSRYLTPTLRFLISPDCYHKMCESCVDRIFSHGPAPCPIPRCGKTLRKARFRTPTFADLHVEREVDIRRRVAAVFNRREEEFEDLRSWNDYLNEVEDITFNLVQGVDVAETEKRFEAYARAHAGEIEENRSFEEQERERVVGNLKVEKEEARARREAVRREEAEMKREMEGVRRGVLERLAGGGDAEAVVGEGRKVQLKRRMDRAAAAERQRKLQQAGTQNGGQLGVRIKGLRAKEVEKEEVVDPFGGWRFAEGLRYFELKEDYVWAGVQESKADVLIGAGGYDVGVFTSRALCEAFAGLGVFVGEEVDEREKAAGGGGDGPVKEDGSSATRKKVVVKVSQKDVKMEDPF